MSQPVKLSDALVLDARVTSEAAKRSIAGQIEFWASIGRAVELVLRAPELAALQRVEPLSKALARPGTADGEQRLADHLSKRPYPHYEPAPDAPGLLVRLDEDGTRTLGRFVKRRFVPHKDRKKGTRRASRRS